MAENRKDDHPGHPDAPEAVEVQSSLLPVITHRMPAGSDPQFPCCGKWVQEHLASRMTEDPDQVTCTGGYPLSDEQLIEAGAEDPNLARPVTYSAEGLTGEQHRDATGHAVLLAADGGDECRDCPWLAMSRASARPVEGREDPSGVLVPEAAVEALIEALGYGGPHSPVSLRAYRVALAAALPYLDRAAYLRGYRIGLRAATPPPPPLAGLVVGPDDHLVINVGPHPTEAELDGYRETLARELPKLDGRVLLVAGSLAVVKGVPDADPLG